MSLPTNASSRLVQSQDRRNATLISDLGHCAVSHPSYNLHHLSSGVTFWSRAMTHGSHTKMTLEMGTRFFGVTLRTPIVGIKFGSFFFERVNSIIESLGRSIAKGLYNSCSTKHLMEARTLEALAGSLSVSHGLLSILWLLRRIFRSLVYRIASPACDLATSKRWEQNI